MKPTNSVVVITLVLSLIGAFTQGFLLQSGSAKEIMVASSLPNIAPLVSLLSTPITTQTSEENTTTTSSPIPSYGSQGRLLKCISSSSCTDGSLTPTETNTSSLPVSSSSAPAVPSTPSSPPPTTNTTQSNPPPKTDATHNMNGVIIPFPLAITALIVVLVIML